MSKSLEDAPLEEMVLSAQQGDSTIQDFLIKKYQPFIAKCVSEVCKRYIDPTKDDEFSVGLLAFNDAIFSYSAEKGCSFLSFAKIVIKRRIIDYIRANKKRIATVSLEENFDMEHMESPIEFSAVKERYEEEQEILRRREEIYDFRDKLKEYNLTLTELTKVSPKHRDARDSAVRTARILFGDIELREYVQIKKKLPIKKLVKKVDVSKKTLERNRKFILAIFIILGEEYIYLKDYLKGLGQ